MEEDKEVAKKIEQELSKIPTVKEKKDFLQRVASGEEVQTIDKNKQ